MTERDGYEHGVPCWVETWQEDPDTAATFYAGVFGWEVEKGSPPGTDTRYYMCRLGGSVVAEPFGSLDGGRMAIVADPAGAVLGVWTPGAHRGAQRVNEPSAYAMSFLRTPDPEV